LPGRFRFLTPRAQPGGCSAPAIEKSGKGLALRGVGAGPCWGRGGDFCGGPAGDVSFFGRGGDVWNRPPKGKGFKGSAAAQVL